MGWSVNEPYPIGFVFVIKFLCQQFLAIVKNPPCVHEVNFKSDWTKFFPDAYSNRQYAIFMCEKLLHRLMPLAAKVVLKSQLFYIV